MNNYNKSKINLPLISFAKLVQVKLKNIHFEVKHRKVAVLLMVDTDRDGNQTDVDRLKNLLPKWGYDTVIQPDNPTKTDMIQALQSVQNFKEPYDVNFISLSLLFTIISALRPLAAGDAVLEIGYPEKACHYHRSSIFILVFFIDVPSGYSKYIIIWAGSFEGKNSTLGDLSPKIIKDEKSKLIVPNKK